MSKNSKATISIIAGILIIVGIFAFFRNKESLAGSTLVGSASYICTDNKMVNAQYYESDEPVKTQPNEKPIPTGNVMVQLSDGRSLTLNQTISGSGVRYANEGETIVLWNKGNGITFTEGNKETFSGCMAVSANENNLALVYGDGSKGMTLRYPTGFSVDESYTYQGFGPSKTISGVKFTIPQSVATGTNLSSDTYISIEKIPGATSCTADLFLDKALGGKVSLITAGDVNYSFSSSTDAGAGNRYEQMVYAIPGTNPCIAIRYFIHYGAIENYPETVKEFDKQALLKQFDAIRKSLTLLQ